MKIDEKALQEYWNKSVEYARKELEKIPNPDLTMRTIEVKSNDFFVKAEGAYEQV